MTKPNGGLAHATESIGFEWALGILAKSLLLLIDWIASSLMRIDCFTLCTNCVLYIVKDGVFRSLPDLVNRHIECQGPVLSVCVLEVPAQPRGLSHISDKYGTTLTLRLNHKDAVRWQSQKQWRRVFAAEQLESVAN